MTDSRDVDALLREVSRSRDAWLATTEGQREMRELVREARRTAVVDMSAEAVDARLRDAAELSALCASLAAAATRPL